MCENSYWDKGVLNAEVKSEINNCSEIEELFSYWKKAQAKDSDYKKAVIYSKKKDSEKICNFISSESFTPDGIICKEKWERADKKVLYIMEEANGNAFSKGKIDYTKAPPKQSIRIDVDENGKEEFWFQQVVYGAKDRRKIYPKLNKIQQKITGKKENLISAAYMNLNKRGGFQNLIPKGICDNYNQYIDKYHDFIMKEIEMMKPDYIVGFKMPDKLIKELQTKGFDRIANYEYHPSSRKSNKDFYGSVKVNGDEEFERLLKDMQQ